MQKNKKLQRKCVNFLTDLQKEERKKRRDQRGTIHMNIHINIMVSLKSLSVSIYAFYGTPPCITGLEHSSAACISLFFLYSFSCIDYVLPFQTVMAEWLRCCT